MSMISFKYVVLKTIHHLWLRVSFVFYYCVLFFFFILLYMMCLNVYTVNFLLIWIKHSFMCIFTWVYSLWSHPEFAATMFRRWDKMFSVKLFNRLSGFELLYWNGCGQNIVLQFDVWCEFNWFQDTQSFICFLV